MNPRLTLSLSVFLLLISLVSFAQSPIGGTPSVCVGSTRTLTDSVAGGSWSSSHTAIATVGITSGVVTGVAAGTATITYTLSGSTVTRTFTVLAPSAPITGTTTIAAGATTTLSDATGGGYWSSGSTAIATVNSATGLVTAVSAGTCGIYYTLTSGCGVYTMFTVTSSSSSLPPIGGTSSVCAGSTRTLTDSVAGGSWSSSNTAIATVGITSGVVTGVAAGTATITYTLGGSTVTRTFTVVAPPGPITGTTTVAAGATTTLSDATAGGYWSSSSTSIAMVNSATGLVTGVSAGTCNIYYVLTSGCAVYTTFTVTSSSSSLPPIGGTASVCIGSTRTLTDSVAGGSWSSSHTAIATVGITSGVVTGVAAGTATITYTLGGSTVTRTFTVLAPPAPITGTTTIAAGAATTLSDAAGGGYWSSGSTAIATVNSATGLVTAVSAGTCGIYYTLTSGCGVYTMFTVTSSSSSLPPIGGTPSVCVGSTRTLTDSVAGGSWSSSHTAIATVGITSGVVTGIAAGTATITYTLGGSTVTRTFTVLAPPAPITGTTTVAAGATTTLSDATAGGYWSSSSTSIAMVNSATGLVTGVSAGTCNIYYVLTSGCAVYTTFTVTSSSSSLPPIGGTASVCIGSTRTLTDSVAGGSWSSSHTAIATVGITSGVVTGVAAGTAIITYTHSGSAVTVSFTVSAPPAPISGGGSICAGTAMTLSDATLGGTWTSGNTSIATVTSSGTVSGVGAGLVNIYYSVAGCGTYHTVTVNAGPAISGSSTICAGSTITLTATPSGGTWTCSSSSVATVSSAGIVTGVGAGVVNIYYTAGGCYAYHTVTVNAAAAISGSSTICAGSTITLTATPSGGTWTCSSSSVATVSPSSGVVTGLSAGVVTIYNLTGSCYAHHTVTVNPLPAITATATPAACGYTYTLSAAGGTTYSWLPAGGLSCTTCATTSDNVTATASYTVTGTSAAGCSSKASVTVDGNRIIGYINFSTTPPDSLNIKVWLIHYNPTDSTLTALDSTYTCLLPGGTTPYYQFYDKPAGNYMVKAKLLHNNPVGSGGYVPTYGSSSLHWYSAATIAHTGATDYSSITMLYGTVPTGPGFIGGSISTGAGKGTSGAVPAVGMLVQLLDAATNNVVAYCYTDGAGAYSFNGLSDGNYIVYPEDYVYYTTQSAAITINGASESATGIDFKQHTISRTITPSAPENIKPIFSAGGVSVYPNPTPGTLNIKWEHQATGTADMLITDVTGRAVYHTTININDASGQTPVGLDLKDGIYLVTIKSATIYYTGKLQVQR